METTSKTKKKSINEDDIKKGRWHKTEDSIKNEDNIKHEDDIKLEDDIWRRHKNKDNIKNEDYKKMKKA